MSAKKNRLRRKVAMLEDQNRRYRVRIISDMEARRKSTEIIAALTRAEVTKDTDNRSWVAEMRVTEMEIKSVRPELIPELIHHIAARIVGKIWPAEP